MEYDKQLIEINNLPILRQQLQAQIKAASPTIERIKCVFGYQKDSIVYVYTAFDFLDEYDKIITQGQLEKFYIYQLIEHESIS